MSNITNVKNAWTTAFMIFSRVRKTPSARQQCWPESFCESGKFLQQAHYWLKNFQIFWKCTNTIQNIQIICKVSRWTGKFPDYLKSVRMNWKVSRWCKKCPENLNNVSGYSKKSLADLKMYLDNLESFWMILKMSGFCKKKSGRAKNVPGWSGSLVNAPYGDIWTMVIGCA